ncbi:hypothetical protein [Actinomadura parmotrematis]|uniref:MarR family transcriptional regulator n=1 Tax=Actinomadura parmotrematis TaxID=2864039 RepID=A0ABS7FUH2_9ACTN|nr:hypothetical protein [Actinomadura parmotrematis]MBW8484054.1 hypothetical protein [Actinomadura parmotrematis]
MADIELGAKDRALLLGLMSAGGAASNPELRDWIGSPIDGAHRRRLEELGLVEGEKRRSYHFELTEKGWAWCVAELSTEAPARSFLQGRVLYRLLPVLRTALEAADTSLAEQVAALRRTGGAALTARIREAYWKLADAPQDWVPLTALRPLLGGAPRADVDAALRELEREEDVHIAPEADQKILTEADREAALRIGGKSKHLLAIDGR